MEEKDTGFTTLDIPPDYDGEESGEYDNEIGSPDDLSQGESTGRSRYTQHRSPRTSNAGESESASNIDQLSNSAPDYGLVNIGFQDEDAPDGRNVREALEMRRRGDGRLSARGDRDFDHRGIYHKRAKSQHLNGFEYYRFERSARKEEPDPDYNDDPPEREMTTEDIAKTRQFLATLKVRKKSRNKRSSSKKKDGAGAAGNYDGGESGPDAMDSNDLGDESFEEEIGLPSARGKMKGLAHRMEMARQVDSAADVAMQYRKRESIWEIKGTSLPRTSSPLTRASKSIKDWYKEVSYNFTFWSRHFKEIEGQCGVATTTYFRFTRWLVKINLLVFIIFFSFLYVPQFITWAEPSKNIFIREATNFGTVDEDINESFNCSQSYVKYVDNITVYSGIPVILDIVKGQGLLEDTSIFYGRYSNLSVTYGSQNGDKVATDFNMSLVYMLVMLVSFLIIFVMVVRTSSNSVRETIMDLENHSIPSYSNAVFAGWDYCIHSEKMAFYKKKIIYNAFQAKIEEVNFKRNQEMKTNKEKIKLYVLRFFINFLVFCILGGCFTAIIFTTNFLLEQQEEELGELESLIIEFLPSIVISILNFSIPLIFIFLVEKENYSPTFKTSLTVFRAVFLRISLVGVLLFSIYYRLFHKRGRESYYCQEEDYDTTETTTTCCGNPLWKTSKDATEENMGSVKCWETYVGQQFYKLAFADFFNVCVLYLGVCAIRKLVWSKFKGRLWLVSKLGLARFDLPLEVLDIVYTQTLCWVGMFFAPLLPAFCLLQTFLYFFVKKFFLMRLCEPPKNEFRASRSYSFFQVVLLVTFAIICVILGYMVGNIQPSKSCGPFRVYSTPEHVMFDAITNEVDTWPELFKGIFNFFGTVAFFIPAFLILGIAIYYYWAMSQGYKRLEKLLQLQLKSESYDKQYLLAKVDEVIKKGELNLHEDGF